MSLPVARNDYEEKILHSLGTNGFFLTGVRPGPNNWVRFLYSIGLYHSKSHPEFIVLGLHDDMAAHVGQKVGRNVMDGKVYSHGDVVDDLIPGYLCKVLDIPRSLTSDWMLSDNWLYGMGNFPAIQIVFQDEGHHWPWDDDAPIQFLRNQPILGIARNQR